MAAGAEDLPNLTTPPPMLCFASVDETQYTVDAAIELLMTFPSKVPPGRDDISPPTQHHIDAFRMYMRMADGQIQHNTTKYVGLGADDAAMVYAYTVESPYALYKWLNAHLMSTCRDAAFVRHVGPFFVKFYRALEKLPLVTAQAHRAIRVNSIPRLQQWWDDYQSVFRVDAFVPFWGVTSFARDDTVVSRKEFVGGEDDRAFVFTCGKLQCVDITGLSAVQGDAAESEVMPLPPATFQVQTSLRHGPKVIVALSQVPSGSVSYVLPNPSAPQVGEVASACVASPPAALTVAVPAAAVSRCAATLSGVCPPHGAVGSIEVIARTTAGAQYTVKASESDEVAAVKARLSLKTHIPAHKQVLVWDGKQLNDAHALSHYGVTANAIGTETRAVHVELQDPSPSAPPLSPRIANRSVKSMLPTRVTLKIGNHYGVVPLTDARDDTTSNRHRWTVDVEAAPVHAVSKVVFHLHPTFNPADIAVCKPPFKITRLGWGTFEVVAKVYLHARATPVTMKHWLSFDNPYTPGDSLAINT